MMSWGTKNIQDTMTLTGVNEHTLMFWMKKKKMITGWIEVMESMKASNDLVQEAFSHVDPESTVCVKKYQEKIKNESSQLTLYFKGGKVSTWIFSFYMFRRLTASVFF